MSEKSRYNDRRDENVRLGEDGQCRWFVIGFQNVYKDHTMLQTIAKYINKTFAQWLLVIYYCLLPLNCGYNFLATAAILIVATIILKHIVMFYGGTSGGYKPTL